MATEPAGFGSLPTQVAQHAVRILEVALRLEEDGKLAEVGGLSYLVQCVEAGEADRRPGETTDELVARQVGEMKRLRSRADRA